MEIRKAASLLEMGKPSPGQLEDINKLTRTALGQEDVYVFAVRLCDNQPDRDMERFSEEAVRALAPMFVGKTGVLDHDWSAEKQMGRIFRTEVVEEGDVIWLKAWVYMLRSEKTEGLIREIEGGIKKEVSVGCAMGATVCSVCGAEYGTCEHQKGRKYKGALCVAVLTDPVDAYEFSFVAVPAQREAGVVKGACRDSARLRKLEQEAEYGRRYHKMLCRDIVKMGLLLDMGLDEHTWTKMTLALDLDGLEQVRDAFTRKTAELFPPQTQLGGGCSEPRKPDSAYLI